VISDALNARDSTSAQVLDESVLDAIGQLQGKWRPDFVDRVITIFLDTARPLLSDLENGSAMGKLAMLHHAGHTLKACSAIIGARSLSVLCEELELAARASSVPDAAARVNAILKEYQGVEAALIRRLARSKTVSKG
jgi:HPt (histidine-containing phosphotransfer) domain-containing protein